jgi:hypothetical protein
MPRTAQRQKAHVQTHKKGGKELGADRKFTYLSDL